MPHAEYIASLPKRHVGCAALFLNDKGELLIVKQSYKEGWSVPGGVVDALESPYAGCVREIKEEIGLDIPNLTFLGVQYERKSSNVEAPDEDVKELMESHDLDKDTAERVQEIMDDLGVDEDDAVEIEESL